MAAALPPVHLLLKRGVRALELRGRRAKPRLERAPLPLSADRL
eukprot:CAMPEP_0113286334 /NCGR_PEP_ID=MMETSP0008_2-20120614/31087_1 /TAXON_ID=97485 /ORGANISM="Prymnesium parvum" /LENGTH=42 /DNA_ID=CAMNT_0000137427 /DNA_START=326 /DNA_END=451 /DNA_ORIENTATION=+ /assembly_acc=CAM_ASM_000153